MLPFSSRTPLNHLTSVRAPQTDSPGQRFNIENTQNRLTGKGVAEGIGWGDTQRIWNRDLKSTGPTRHHDG